MTYLLTRAKNCFESERQSLMEEGNQNRAESLKSSLRSCTCNYHHHDIIISSLLRTRELIINSHEQESRSIHEVHEPGSIQQS